MIENPHDFQAVSNGDCNDRRGFDRRGIRSLMGDLLFWWIGHNITGLVPDLSHQASRARQFPGCKPCILALGRAVGMVGRCGHHSLRKTAERPFSQKNATPRARDSGNKYIPYQWSVIFVLFALDGGGKAGGPDNGQARGGWFPVDADNSNPCSPRYNHGAGQYFR